MVSLSPQVTLLNNKHFLLSSEENLSPNLLIRAASPNAKTLPKTHVAKKSRRLQHRELPSSRDFIQRSPWDILCTHVSLLTMNSSIAAHSKQAAW